MFEKKVFKKAYKEASAEKRERGKNVRVRFIFRRHEQPGKTPEGMSADYLTELGIERAKERGRKLAGQEEYLLVAGSRGVKRARETGGYLLGAFRDEEGASRIVNREMDPDRQAKLGHGKVPPADVVIYRSGDLDPVKNFKPLFEEAKAKGATDLTSISEYWLNHPARARELGIPTGEESAAEFARRLNLGIKMSGKLFEGLDVRFENLTHGPRLEAFLREVLVKDGKRGFEKLEEIGGPFNPGEEIEFDIKRDDEGEVSLKLYFRGREYDVDTARLQELLRLYKEKRKKAKR